MNQHHKHILQMIKENNGFITSSQITDAGIPRRCLSEMVAEKILYKVDRGIYALPDVWEDELFFLQYRYTKGIFSHETALYLLSMTDRTPISYTMTFPKGYHATGIKKQNLKAKYIISKNYELGIIQLPSPSGNIIQVYDIERTLCDIVKTKHAGDIQVINQAFKMYAAFKTKDIAKLISFAEQLEVKKKILTYLEVLL